MSACSMDRQIVEALYKYEVTQFKEPDRPRNKKALEQWKLQHAEIFKGRKICDSFIIINWYDSIRRSPFSGQRNIEYYGTRYYLCNDTGSIFKNHDSISRERFTYLDRKYNFLESVIYDSIIHGSKIELMFSGTHPSRIIQIVKIKHRKITISGFNLNGRLELQEKI